MSKRNLYLTNIPVEEALERFQHALSPYLKPQSEPVAVVDSLDRVAAAAIFAANNSPLYDSAAMDGIAVVSAATHGASESVPLLLKQGEAFLPIDTGDPIRPPFDAVIMAEELRETDEGDVIIRSAATPWQHIRPVGEDIVQGEMLLPGRHKIRPFDIGVLLSGGITEICVIKRPTVAIIPTGTELIEPGAAISEGGIIESNSRMLEALVRQGGGLPTRFAPVPDDYDLLKAALEDAAGRFDLVLISAGTSAGREDYTVCALREIGQVVVHGVAMKPGKPVVLAVASGKPVIGVPGYPVSAYLAYETFAAPVLQSLSGVRTAGTTPIRATLTRRLVSSLKHREYVRVKVGWVGGQLVASPLARGAGAAMSLVRADGFCVIEQNTEGIEAGTQVNILPCRNLDDLTQTVVSIGSHDLILDLISDMMPTFFPGTHLSSTHVGSMGGLMALKNGEAHIAPIHLLDEDTGHYNIPVIRNLFPGRRMALLKGPAREQGILTQKGNPLNISSLDDFTRIRYVNRQRGAGTRILLDYKLKTLGIDPADITGYEREAATHMAVAAMIQNGSADGGMGIFSAARAMDLCFIPVGKEEYDFALAAESLEMEPIRSLIAMLKHPAFRQKLQEMGGYTVEHCGEVVLLDC